MVMRHRHDFSRLASARLDAASIDSTSMDSTSIDSTRLDSTPLGMLLRGSCVHAWPCVYVVASSSPLPACLPYVSLPLTICLIGVTHLTPSKSYSSLPSTILSRSVRELHSSLHGAFRARCLRSVMRALAHMCGVAPP